MILKALVLQQQTQFTAMTSLCLKKLCKVIFDRTLSN